MTNLEKKEQKRDALREEIPKLEARLRDRKAQLSKVEKEIEEINNLLSLEFIRKKKITSERLIAAFGPLDSDESAKPAAAYRQYQPKPSIADEDEDDE